MSDRPYNRPCSDVCVGGLIKETAHPLTTRVLFAQYGRPTNRPCSPMLISNSPPNLTEPDYERIQLSGVGKSSHPKHQPCLLASGYTPPGYIQRPGSTLGATEPSRPVRNNTAQSSVSSRSLPLAGQQWDRNVFVLPACVIA